MNRFQEYADGIYDGPEGQQESDDDTIYLNMTTADGEHAHRRIDISNLAAYGIPGRMSNARQRELLEGWITDRGNDQHDTTLTLNYWIIE